MKTYNKNIKDLVLNALKTNSGKWLKSGKIQAITKLKDHDIRKAARRLTCEDHILIISSRRGFKIGESIEDLDDYVRDLKSRNSGVYKRLKALKLIRREMTNGRLAV